MPAKAHRAAPAYGGGLPPSQRPHKICLVCGRPFAWRKKWARDWDNVIYCSQRCRTQAKAGAPGVAGPVDS